MDHELVLGAEVEIQGRVFACDGAAHPVSDAWLVVPSALGGDMDRVFIGVVVVEGREVEVVADSGHGLGGAEAVDDEIGVVDVEIVEDSSGAGIIGVEISGPVGARSEAVEDGAADLSIGV